MNKLSLPHITSSKVVRAGVWVVYAVVAYFVAMYATALIVFIVNRLGMGWSDATTTGALLLRCLVYALTIALLYGGLRLAKLGARQIIRITGFARTMDWRDIGLSLVGFVAYGLVTVVVLTLVSHIPGFNADQAQDVGVTNVYGSERLLAFVILVLVAPLAEEILFRGMLYGYLKQLGVLRLVAVLVVSALFGLAHGQWNVGIDVFCLSVILCVLRELTGSIWAGIIVHIIKNLLAFWLVFIVAHG